MSESASQELSVSASSDDRGQSLFGRRRSRRWMEAGIHAALALCSAASILTTTGIVLVLVMESIGFFSEVSLWEFATGTRWTPLLKPRHFGVLPLLCGTLLVALGSGVVAIPLGLAAAVYLAEYASPRFRAIVKPVLEVLAGIPSVVYGYFAVVFVTPLLRTVFPSIQVFNAASACVVVGIMVLPMVVSLSEEALRAVPRSLRDAAYALGSTKLDVTARVVIPAAMSGIASSFLLAVSRAIGETMAAALAAGATPKLTLNPLESVQTMSAYIVQVSLGDTPAGTLEYRTIFAVGMALFLLTLVFNIASQWIRFRFQQRGIA
ncbi:MAG: phosphate ABC transporter permease subunit PstC [Planctomycetales bacterium]